MVIPILEISENQFKKRDIRVVSNDFEPVISDITWILSNRMDKTDRDFLKKCLKQLQEKITLSTEFIRYCLLTEQMRHNEAIKFLFTNYSKSIVKKEMSRLYRFLKANNIKTKIRASFYKRWARMDGDLTRFRIGKFIHTFKV